MSCGCNLSLHIKEWDGLVISSFPSKFQMTSLIKFRQQRPQLQRFLPLRRNNPTTIFLTTRSSFWSPSSSFGAALFFVRCLQAKLPRELPFLSDSSFSQKEEDCELSSEALTTVAGGIVALGKFDALHIGHRELAIQASRVGIPFLLSFVGMAEVLGWAPRAPIVAKCDRERVLSSWAPSCGNVAPKEVLINFAGVRHLTPRQFVEKLSQELGVHGVVAGENYRFGYKAAGDASELVRLCAEYGMQVYIINSVMDKNQDLNSSCIPEKKERGQVSSTRVRYALSKGNMKYVSELLGREHRLILSAGKREQFVGAKNLLSAPISCLLNLPPKEGLYESCSLIIREDKQFPCGVFIDSSHIHIESDDKDHIYDASQGLVHLGLEFKG